MWVGRSLSWRATPTPVTFPKTLSGFYEEELKKKKKIPLQVPKQKPQQKTCWVTAALNILKTASCSLVKEIRESKALQTALITELCQANTLWKESFLKVRIDWQSIMRDGSTENWQFNLVKGKQGLKLTRLFLHWCRRCHEMQQRKMNPYWISPAPGLLSLSLLFPSSYLEQKLHKASSLLTKQNAHWIEKKKWSCLLKTILLKPLFMLEGKLTIEKGLNDAEMVRLPKRLSCKHGDQSLVPGVKSWTWWQLWEGEDLGISGSLAVVNCSANTRFLWEFLPQRAT